MQDSPPVPHAGLPARAYRQAAPEWSPCLACARFPPPAQTFFLVGHRYEGAAPADPTRVPAPVAPPKRTAVLRLAQPPHYVSHEHGGVAPAGPAAAPARGLPPARRARMTRMNRTQCQFIAWSSNPHERHAVPVGCGAAPAAPSAPTGTSHPGRARPPRCASAVAVLCLVHSVPPATAAAPCWSRARGGCACIPRRRTRSKPPASRAFTHSAQE